MSATTAQFTAPDATPSPEVSTRWRRYVWRLAALFVVVAIAGGVGVFVHRVRSTVLVESGWSYAGNTPQITLDYGGGDRYVVDDTAGVLHPIMFSFQNKGPATMTLQGVEDFLPLDVAGFRIARMGDEGPGLTVATTPRTSLAGVVIRPGQQFALWMYVRAQGCVASADGAATTTIDSVPITVQVLGFRRVDWVPLTTLVAVMNNPTENARSDPRSCLRTAR